MIDHTSVVVSDFEKSREFYSRALSAIGYRLLMEFPGSGDRGAVAGYGVPPKPDFWIRVGKPGRSQVHVAFGVEKRSLVDAYYDAAIAAGGTDNGAPGVRELYHPTYYGAFVLDPDGYNIEAVCHKPE